MERLASDVEVISIVSGMPIDIVSNLPIVNKYQYPFNDKVDAFIESGIQNLLKKGVTRNSIHEPSEFISPIFLREKIDFLKLQSFQIIIWKDQENSQNY